MLTVNAPETRYEVCKFRENRARICPRGAFITGSIARSASRRCLIHSEADFEAHYTDGGEIWHGPLLVPNFTAIRSTTRV